MVLNNIWMVLNNICAISKQIHVQKNKFQVSWNLDSIADVIKRSICLDDIAVCAHPIAVEMR